MGREEKVGTKANDRHCYSDYFLGVHFYDLKKGYAGHNFITYRLCLSVPIESAWGDGTTGPSHATGLALSQ